MEGRKKAILIWTSAAVFLLAVVIGFVLLRGDHSGESPLHTAAYKLGEVIEAGGIRFSVVRSYESKGTDSERPMLRYVFTIARVSLNNESTQPIAVKPEDFSLFIDGKEIPSKALGYVFDQLSTVTLEPGTATEGALSWETPLKCRSKILVYRSLAGGPIAVDLLKKPE